MDILYIVGSGSKWDNNELRYSLRSIEKNGVNVGRVFIVGDDPGFMSNECRYIYCYDRWPSKKHNNIHYKIKIAMKYGMDSDHFLIASDDHYYIQETDFDNYPLYYRSEEIPYRCPNSEKPNLYWKSIFDTRALLIRHGLPIYFTSPHLFKHFDVDIYKDNLSIFEEAFNLRYGGEVNCIMGNLMIANGYTPTYIEDKKIKQFNSIDTIKEELSGLHAFSISDKAIGCGMDMLLRQLFPYKSKYEK